jgi:pimeloyl-ACP methyl ester carboxylesterase
MYAASYAAPGAMRAAFEVYRAFDRDADDNKVSLDQNGKLTVPVLAVFAAVSNSGPLVEEMMHEVAENVVGLRIDDSGHWIPEENSQTLAAGLIQFLC